MKTYDYKDQQKDIKGKTDRLNAIDEIQSMAVSQTHVIATILPYMDESMQMIENNIFRPLPSVIKQKLNFADTGMD